MTAKHNQASSKPGNQVFWLSVPGEAETLSNTQLRAWLAIGFDDCLDYDTLSGWQKAQWRMAFTQALQVEALKLAYKTPEVKWLYEQDVDFDLNPFTNGWRPSVTDADIRLTIDQNDNAAMLFKLTFGGSG